MSGYTIMTINGVLTNESGAIENRDKLRKLVDSSYKNEKVVINYLYNPSHTGGIGDFTKSLYQKFFDERAVSDYDLVEMIRSASQQVKTQKLLLVAHSQGNFYANSFYDTVVDTRSGVPAQSFGVYGVATPANRVAGDGKWLTSANDVVISGFINGFTLAAIMDPNVYIAYNFSEDATGHSFTDTYLKHEGARIVADIGSSLDKLKANDIQDVEKPCIAEQKITTVHKVKGGVFAVTDFVASAGFSAVKWGINAPHNAGTALGNVIVTLGSSFFNTDNNTEPNTTQTVVVDVIDEIVVDQVTENNQASNDVQIQKPFVVQISEQAVATSTEVVLDYLSVVEAAATSTLSQENVLVVEEVAVEKAATTTEQEVVFYTGGGYASLNPIQETAENQEMLDTTTTESLTASSTDNLIEKTASSTENIIVTDTTSTTEEILVLEDPFLLIDEYNFNDKNLVLSWGLVSSSASSTESIIYDLQYKENQDVWQDLEVQTSASSVEFLVKGEDVSYSFRIKAIDNINNIESGWVEAQFFSDRIPIVINEVAWMGTEAQANDEWIELYNKTNYPIDLSNWVLENSKKLSIELDGIIGPKGYYLLERTATTTTGELEDQIYTGAMNNLGLGADLFLKDGAGNTIDFVSRWHAGDSGGKKTMERISLYAYEDDSYNWMTFSGEPFAKDAEGNYILGTPGKQNSNFGIFTHVSRTILQDTTWIKEASPYYINYGIFVNEGASLTINPGVTVKLGNAPQGYTRPALTIKGTLTVLGTEEENIVFTSFFDDSDGVDSDKMVGRNPARGNWRGLIFENSKEKSVLDNVQVKYGGAPKRVGMGYIYNGVLQAHNSTLEISNCSVENSFVYGLYAEDGGVLRVSNCTIKDTEPLYRYGKYSAGYGIYIKDASSTAEVLDSVFENNGTGILSRSFSSDALIIKNNIFSNNDRNVEAYIFADVEIKNNKDINKEGGIYISGNVASSTIAVLEKNEMPYIIESRITVQEGGELKINPGVVVKVSRQPHSQDSLVTPLIVYGTLNAVGTNSEKIIFTFISDDEVDGYNSDRRDVAPTAGQWRSIKFFGQGASSSILDYVDIKYGGATNKRNLSGPSVDFRGSIYIKDSSPKISNCSVEQSMYIGINIEEGAHPEISKCDIKNTQEISVYGKKSGGYGIRTHDYLASADISENIFEGNIAADIYLKTATTSEFKISKNEFIEGKDNVIIDGYLTDKIIFAANKFEKFGYIKIKGSTYGNVGLIKGVPYLIDYLFVGENSKLKIEPGTILNMARSARFFVDGEIEALGTIGEKIQFTAAPTKYTEENGFRAGLWGVIEIREKSQKSVFENVIFSYGGSHRLSQSNLSAVLFVLGKNTQISNTLFEENTGGVAGFSDGEVSISNSTFKDTMNEALYTQDNAKIDITNSNINPSLNSRYTARGDINAQNNWWGDASGPYHKTLNPTGKGGEVARSVDFNPWAFEEF